MGKIHILMIPYPVQGHVIPLMELAQSLAKYGFNITFVNTESTHKSILNSLSAKNSLHDQIHLISVLDESETGEDQQNVPGKLSEAIFKIMPKKIEKLIIQENYVSEDEKITCVIADQSLGWALELAAKMGIKRAAFLTAAAANLILGFNIPKLLNDGIIDNDGTPAIKDHTFQFEPTMPMTNTSDLLWTRMGNLTMQKIIFDMLVHNNKAVKSANWIICNSTYDLEPGAFKLAPEIVPIGPLLSINRLKTLPPEAEPRISSKESPNSQAGSFWPKDSTCLNWLDQQPLCSVVYVAFGSSTIFNEAQFQELALGLELSNKSFLWVVRTNSLDAKTDVFLKFFLNRIGRQKGKIVSWAPQQKVLSHPSIGCFISHCGWNSTIESISNGVPILCWPYFADQFMNQSYICDIWKVGLGLKKGENGIINCGEIKDKVEELLGNDEFKKRALQFKEMTMSSVKEGGKSHQNFINFIEWIKSS